MTIALSAFEPFGAAQHRRLKLSLFAIWLTLVSFMAWHHAFSRDEVRALSIALRGDNVIEMLQALHGEGHPALWYLLLRGAYATVKSPVVLPLLSIGIATAAALLLVLRSPFSWWMIALLLLSEFFVFEYSVMARNYGIAALLLFLLARFYSANKTHGVLLGIFLFLLANTNVHSVLLVGSFLLFWLIDLKRSNGFGAERWRRTFLVNGALAAAGVVACVATIYPTYNDAALAIPPVTARRLLTSILLPAQSIPHLLFPEIGSALSPHQIGLLMVLMSLLLFGSTLGLVRSPGAFAAALTALIGLSLFFHFIYEGGYRHYALWIVFLVSLYWATRSEFTPRAPAAAAGFQSRRDTLSATGSAVMVLLVALQVPPGIDRIAGVILQRPPASRVADFANFVAVRINLRDAIVIADPDTLVESLPYYLHNPTYLVRGRRFDNVDRFTKKARLSIDLDDMLQTAKMLAAQSGKPVIILLHEMLNASAPQTYHEGYDWIFRTTPDQVHDFLRATRFLARFAPASGDESFDAYVLDSSG